MFCGRDFLGDHDRIPLSPSLTFCPSARPPSVWPPYAHHLPPCHHATHRPPAEHSAAEEHRAAVVQKPSHESIVWLNMSSSSGTSRFQGSMGSSSDTQPVRKKGQECTRGVEIDRARQDLNGAKLPVDFSKDFKQAVGRYASMFNNECGYIARNHAPLSFKDWRHIPQAVKVPLRLRLDNNFIIDQNNIFVRDIIDYQMNKSWKQHKYKLHKYFKEIGGEQNLEVAKRQKHKDVEDQAEWEYLCECWSNGKWVDQSNKNSDNRKKRKWVSYNGSVSTPNHHIRLGRSLEEPTGEIETFKKMHYNNQTGWINEEAENAYEAMVTMRREHPVDDHSQQIISDLDIMKEVLGSRPGYLKGWSRVLRYRDSGEESAVRSSQSHPSQRTLAEMEAGLASMQEKLAGLASMQEQFLWFQREYEEVKQLLITEGSLNLSATQPTEGID